MKKYEYEIAGLDCAACANEIQEGLNKNPEIKCKCKFCKDEINIWNRYFSRKGLRRLYRVLSQRLSYLRLIVRVKT